MFHVHENACKHVFMRFGIDSGKSILTGRAALFACFFVSFFLSSFLPSFLPSEFWGTSFKKIRHENECENRNQRKKPGEKTSTSGPGKFFSTFDFFGNQFSKIFQRNFYRKIWISKGGSYGQNFSIFFDFFFDVQVHLKWCKNASGAPGTRIWGVLMIHQCSWVEFSMFLEAGSKY